MHVSCAPGIRDVAQHIPVATAVHRLVAHTSVTVAVTDRRTGAVTRVVAVLYMTSVSFSLPEGWCRESKEKVARG